MYSVKGFTAIISVSYIIGICSADSLNAAAVDRDRTAGTEKSAADTCAVQSADRRDYAAVDRDCTAGAKITSADACGIVATDSNNVAAVYRNRSALARRSAADSCGVAVDSAGCVNCALIYRESSVRFAVSSAYTCFNIALGIEYSVSANRYGCGNRNIQSGSVKTGGKVIFTAESY